MTTREERPRSAPQQQGRHHITDHDIYLLVCLEVAVMLLWVGWQLADVDLTVTTGSGSGAREVSLAALTITTALATVASYALLWLLRARDLRAWTVIAGVVLLGSFAGPLSATTLIGGVALGSFHVVVGAGLILGVRHLHRTAPGR